MRIIRNIPTGDANTARRLRAPFASAPRDKLKNETAAIRSSGAPQQIAIPNGPFSQPFPCIEQATEPSFVFAVTPDRFSGVTFSSSEAI